jgi:putative heme-binding domain-containing protein
MRVLHLNDGRVFSGRLTAKSDRTLTMQTLTETVTVRRDEVARLDELPVSVMPDGLCDGLSEGQFRDLIAYLMHKTQVPLPRP